MSAEPVQYIAGGAVFEDWMHDASNAGDLYFYGRCAECDWCDCIDHRDSGVAEAALTEHLCKKHS
jgi:hypothetical protein